MCKLYPYSLPWMVDQMCIAHREECQKTRYRIHSCRVSCSRFRGLHSRVFQFEYMQIGFIDMRKHWGLLIWLFLIYQKTHLLALYLYAVFFYHEVPESPLIYPSLSSIPQIHKTSALTPSYAWSLQLDLHFPHTT